MWGRIGLLVFIIVQFAAFVFQTIYSLNVMLPSAVVAPLSVLIPSTGLQNLLKIALVFELDKGGLQWNNLS
jgi:hypothetical protein